MNFHFCKLTLLFKNKKIWDLRSGKNVYDIHEQEDAITDFGLSSNCGYLLSTR